MHDALISPPVAPTTKPVVLFPHFNPPLCPPPRRLSDRRWFRRVLRISDTPLYTPFDVDGVKPQCYSLHATTVEIESPQFSPQELATVVKYMATQARLTRSGVEPWVGVYKVSPDTVVKPHMYAHEAITEALNLSMLRTMTTIPVPEVRQVVVNASSMTYLVMEYIDGETLASCWHRLSLLSKLRIAWTLRSYVGQLRHLRRAVPGTLDGAQCTGPLFTDYGAGPFAAYDELTAWLNHKLHVSQRMKHAPLDAPLFDNSWPLVFTHLDLCPRNVILGHDGKVYLLDWETSGFYPAWFEYVGMRSDEHFNSSSWSLLIPWISHSVRTRKIIEKYWKNIVWAVKVGFLM